MKNFGKQFEEDFRNSVPSWCMLHRLRDSAQSFKKSNLTSFSWDNPCDFFMYDSNSHLLYAIECKTTKYKSMSVQLDKNDTETKMIKYHQVESLLKMSKYDGIIAGFLLNFRDEKNNTERLYFINVTDFVEMLRNTKKSSCNEIDIILNHGIKVCGERKRVHFNWDIASLLKLQAERV